MRKVTISMICGIIIGMIISNISQNFTVKLPTIENAVDIPPVATKVERIENPFNTIIAPWIADYRSSTTTQFKRKSSLSMLL